MELVPEGGDWRDLPESVAKDYMGGSYLLGGGKTGMARRLAMDEPSLTLTCSPAQKQTERCHPKETRPLTVREYARIQTFPDNWLFCGNMSDQYKQIGNAVPVNLAWAIGRSIIRLMNDIQAIMPEKTANCSQAVRKVMGSTNGGQLSIDFESLFESYPDGNIYSNGTAVSDSGFRWNVRTKHLLVGYVTRQNEKFFKERTAKIYYTGEKFPASIALNKVYYFMPYIKNKGVRDLYLIKLVRIGTKQELNPDNQENGYRLVFEIDYVRQLFDEYKPVTLNILNTYLDTTLGGIMKM